jgi:DNA-binding CsgD family transcriptional regulator/sugar-specific transcriptional regulator TrmB
MSESALSDPGFTSLNDVEARAYRDAVLLGRFVREEMATTLGVTLGKAAHIEERLSSLSLLRPMPGEPELLVPVSPDAAVADLVGPSESQIRDLQRAVRMVRQEMSTLRTTYFEGRQQRNQAEAFDVITDIDALQAMLDEWGERCRTEMLTAQPGGARPPGLLANAQPKVLERLQRGVRIRHLYQHTARGDLATAAYVQTVTLHGAEVRTTEELIDRIVIYDREVAFLPEQKVEGRPPGAVVVREPTLVGFLCRVYEHLWASGTQFAPGCEESPEITDDLKRSIIRLMAQGHKDELVARRLGMSVRTCRRYISQIMISIDADSRFQAGVKIALMGLLDLQ